MGEREIIIAQHKEHVFYPWKPQNAITNPIVISGGKGSYFWDIDGKRYIDFSSQLMNMNIGHGHPDVIRAIQQQAETLAFAYPGLAYELMSMVVPGGAP